MFVVDAILALVVVFVTLRVSSPNCSRRAKEDAVSSEAVGGPSRRWCRHQSLTIQPGIGSR